MDNLLASALQCLRGGRINVGKIMEDQLVEIDENETRQLETLTDKIVETPFNWEGEWDRSDRV